MIKGVCKTIKNQRKGQKSGFHGTLLGSPAANLLENILVRKPKIPARGVIRAGEGIIRAREVGD